MGEDTVTQVVEGRKRRKRDSRGLGPFSGGQLTIIIVTFAVLLLFPVGAWALSFSNVAITDPGGVNQARVDAGHNLHAAIADPAGVNVAKVDAKNNLNTAIHDASTGTAAKVNGLGQVSVAATVTGTVKAVPSPTYPDVGPIIGVGTSPTLIIKGFGGNGTVVTKVFVDFWQASATGSFEQINFYLGNADCSTIYHGGFPIFDVNPSGVGLVTVPLDPGLQLLTGYGLCAKTTDGANVNADVSYLWFNP